MVGSGHDVVVLSAANHWDGPWFADQQLALSLARHRRVLYVDRPISRISARRNPYMARSLQRPRLRQQAPNLMRLTVEVMPGIERPGVRWSTVRLMARAVRRALRGMDARAAAVIDTSPMFPLTGQIGEGRSIYWAQDDYQALARLYGHSAARVARAEQRLVEAVDDIVVANPTVAGVISAQGRTPRLIPFGCDVEHFAAAPLTTPATEVSIPTARAVFMGHLGERIEWSLLRAVVARDVPLLLVGPTHPHYEAARLRPLLEHPLVQWVGAQRFEDLPAYLSPGSVGLVPYRDSEFNRSSFPLKTLEYLSAGLAVVATDLPAVRWLDSPLITVASDPESYGDAVRDLTLADEAAGAAADRQALASAHSWERRAAEFVELLDA